MSRMAEKKRQRKTLTDDDSSTPWEGEMKKRKYHANKISPTQLLTDFNVQYAVPKDECDIKQCEIDEVLKHISDFTSSDEKSSVQLSTKMKDHLLENDMLKDYEKYMPEDMNELYKMKIDDEHRACSYNVIDLGFVPPFMEITNEIDRLWRKLQILDSDKYTDLPENLQNLMSNIFDLWCNYMSQDKDGTKDGVERNHKPEIAKRMLAVCGNLGHCQIRHHDNSIFNLTHPVEEYQHKLRPDLVFSSTSKCDKALIPRIVAEVYTDQWKRTYKRTKQQSRRYRYSMTDSSSSYKDDVTGSDFHSSPSESAEYGSNEMNSTTSDNDEMYNSDNKDILRTKERGDNSDAVRLSDKSNLDILKSCPVSIKSDSVRQRLFGQHLGQLIACGQVVYPTFLRPLYTGLKKLSIIGLFVIDMDVYFTKVEAPVAFWKSCLFKSWKDEFGNYHPTFSVSSWHLNMGIKQHFLPLAAFLKVYSESDINRKVLRETLANAK